MEIWKSIVFDSNTFASYYELYLTKDASSERIERWWVGNKRRVGIEKEKDIYAK